MNFDMEKIKEFIALAKSEGLSELSYERENESITVRLGAPSLPYPFQMPTAIAGASGASIANTEAKPSEKNLKVISSPFVGTFYTSASPDFPPYVKVGDHVVKGQVLCIVEAMKIMNEIEADSDGTIVEVCVENENYVEFGEALFKIRK